MKILLMEIYDTSSEQNTNFREPLAAYCLAYWLVFL